MIVIICDGTYTFSDILFLLDPTLFLLDQLITIFSKNFWPKVAFIRMSKNPLSGSKKPRSVGFKYLQGEIGNITYLREKSTGSLSRYLGTYLPKVC